MAFKNLEEKFNSKVQELYSTTYMNQPVPAKGKFADGRLSDGRFDQPLMVVAPGESRFGVKHESRRLPFSSGPRDIVRLSKFSLSSDGIKFYISQAFQQTTNTFEAKRFLNPAFVVASATKLYRVTRHTDPPLASFGNLARSIIGISFKTDTNYKNVKKLGQLQVGTYDGFKNERIDAKIIKRVVSIFTSKFTRFISAATAKNNVGDVYKWSESRPELISGNYVVKRWLDSSKPVTFDVDLAISVGGLLGVGIAVAKFAIGSRNAEKNSSFLHGGKIKPDGVGGPLFSGTRYGVTTISYGKSPGVFRGYSQSDYTNVSIRGLSSAADNYRTNTLSNEPARAGLATRYNSRNHLTKSILERRIRDYQESISDEKSIPFLKYFTADPEAITISSQSALSRSLNARDLASSAREDNRRISYIRDPLNTPPEVPSENVLSRYSDIKAINSSGDGIEDDPILVSFAMGRNNHVQFRAFITDLNQSISPDYKTYQYVGRIEKFIMYNSVQRSVNFKLNLLAFSKNELETVWNRLNYLTSFVYPYGFNKGILQPNIIRFTIGRVFTDQPGYVTSFSTAFGEIAQTWDIDEEVPIGATVSMAISIIEKDTKWANKPFYATTGDL